ncbi:MAG: zf-TFIIB domain-containing protein [Caldilineales bacterium]|nr:zf-TFIIB domain-containing protein [Caldilineales bacterium]
MKEVDREGVLIDTCTQCRGVWLDRGELEKLASRIGGSDLAPSPRDAHPAQRHHDDDWRRRTRDWDDDDEDRHRGYRKKSKLSRLMDFFD